MLFSLGLFVIACLVLSLILPFFLIRKIRIRKNTDKPIAGFIFTFVLFTLFDVAFLGLLANQALSKPGESFLDQTIAKARTEQEAQRNSIENSARYAQELGQYTDCLINADDSAQEVDQIKNDCMKNLSDETKNKILEVEAHEATPEGFRESMKAMGEDNSH